MQQVKSWVVFMEPAVWAAVPLQNALFSEEFPDKTYKQMSIRFEGVFDVSSKYPVLISFIHMWLPSFHASIKFLIKLKRA